MDNLLALVKEGLNQDIVHISFEMNEAAAEIGKCWFWFDPADRYESEFGSVKEYWEAVGENEVAERIAETIQNMLDDGEAEGQYYVSVLKEQLQSIQRQPVIYISGKMTGLADSGRSAFYEAERRLRENGYQKILNPASLPDGLTYDQYMSIDLAMVTAADMVVLLPGHETSKGSKAERSLAESLMKKVLTIEQLLCNCVENSIAI